MDDGLIRLACFLGGLLLFGMLEYWRPWRSPPGWRHKAINLGIVVVDSLIVRLIVPVSLAAVAMFTAQHRSGLLVLVPLPAPLAIIFGILLLDLTIYVQHMLFHRIALLWRLHRVHHTDPTLDVTTGVRFHPLEIIISACIKLAAIVVFGVPAMAVLVFEVLLNVSSLFNHANLRLPAWLDRLLRFLIVTPGMHRVHHSAVAGELNHNFGFNLSGWDRLFGTYLGRSTVGEERMPVGLPDGQDARAGFVDLLLLPFRRE